MSVGSLKTLLTMLQQAPSLSGVNVSYGEELVQAQDLAPPRVVIVPVGGSWIEPGYFQSASANLESIWSTNESIDIYIFGYSKNLNAQPIDHADETENLRAKVLQAFQFRREVGLFFKPMSGRWAQMGDSVNRYGRVYVLTIQVEIAVADVSQGDATVSTVTLNPPV